MLGPSLKAARKAANLTQTELARLSGVDQSQISKIERGERKDPGFTKIRKLEHALGVRFLDDPSCSEGNPPSCEPNRQTDTEQGSTHADAS